MIIFEKIRWKNFLGTGDEYTEVDLGSHRSTLIVGSNGAGKSTLLDALFFALFGKAHRNIRKGQIVNSVNQRDCVVEISFVSGSTPFRVVRGIKPQVFEIYRDGVLIDQMPSTREYQSYLESMILKMSERSFRQIAVLGSSVFVPFMQLPAAGRREVIEDLLDINVFGAMKNILSTKMGELKASHSDKSHEVSLLDTEVKAYLRHTQEMESVTEATIRDHKDQIQAYQGEIDDLKEVNRKHQEWIDQNDVSDKIQECTDTDHKILKYRMQFEQQIKDLVKNAKFYESHEVCPTCTQAIPHDLRESKYQECKDKASVLKDAVDKAMAESNSINEVLKGLRAIEADISTKRADISTNKAMIKRITQSIKDMKKAIRSLESKGTRESEHKVEDLKASRDAMRKEVAEIAMEIEYGNACLEMLKDTGIKTKIIEEYLPLMNQLINQYLQALDFFVLFTINNRFEETIKSRHRDDFSYESFSEGEKARINLALLFTWREIASIKNTMTTNLLLLDETFDSSLDRDGIEGLFKIFDSLDKRTNIVVISHKGDDIMDNRFDRKITFSKQGNFSHMVVEEETSS